MFEVAKVKVDEAIEFWLDPDDVKELSYVFGRTSLSNQSKGLTPEQLVTECTYLSVEDWRNMLNLFLFEQGVKLGGIGVELGAGCGIFSNLIKEKFPQVERIYGVEIVPEFVSDIQVRVTSLLGNSGVVVPVVGSFDQMKLADSSVDFVLDYDSLHHSFDLSKTMKEVARVLKPGGRLIVIDRVHYNSMKEEQRRQALAINYGEEFKRKHGMPLDKPFTREENGEHEIKESEWVEAINQSGLVVDSMVRFHRKSYKELFYAFVSLIPYNIRKINGRLRPLADRVPLGFFRLYMPGARRKRNGLAGKFQIIDFPFSDPRGFVTKTVITATKV